MLKSNLAADLLFYRRVSSAYIFFIVARFFISPASACGRLRAYTAILLNLLIRRLALKVPTTGENYIFLGPLLALGLSGAIRVLVQHIQSALPEGPILIKGPILDFWPFFLLW